MHVSAVVRLPPLNDMLVALAAAGAVTSARQALLSVWPAFSDATDTSNKQVQL